MTAFLQNENISSIAFFIVLLVFIRILDLCFIKITNRNTTEQIGGIYKKIRFSVLISFLFIGLNIILEKFNLTWIDDGSIPWVKSGILFLWVIFLLQTAGRLAPQKSMWKRGLFVVILLSALIYGLSIWGLEIDHEIRQLMIIPGALLVSCILYLGGERLIQPLVKKTKTGADDALYQQMLLPICIIIFLFGVLQFVEQEQIESIFLNPSLIWTLIILAIGISLQRTVWMVLEEFKQSGKWSKRHVTSMTILQHSSKILILFFGLYFILMAFGFDPSHWLTFGTVVTAVLAYAAQDTLGSIFASAAIIIDSPYSEGDFLKLENDVRGTVKEIGFRSTKLLTPDDILVIIPNSKMANAQIINMSRQPPRLDCSAGVAYGSDVDRVKEILLEISNELEYIHKDKLVPQVHFVSMGASSLDFVLRVWLTSPDRFIEVQDKANMLIYKRFQAEGIEIPYTKQDVYLYPMGKLSDNPGE